MHVISQIRVNIFPQFNVYAENRLFYNPKYSLKFKNSSRAMVILGHFFALLQRSDHCLATPNNVVLVK